MVIGLVFLAVTTVVVVWWLRRRNRVSPSRRSPAPLVWLAVPTPGARLHRRLRNVVTVARMAERSGGVADLVAEVEQQAVVLDHHVVITSRFPRRQRGARWRQLDDQVSQLEVLGTRLLAAAVEAASHPGLPGAQTDPLARIAERLEALEAARGELAGVERSAGLDRPTAGAERSARSS